MFEIESAWTINSSKQEIILSRDSKKLFVQRFVTIFGQIESTWRREIKEQAPQLIYCTVVGLSEAATGGAV